MGSATRERKDAKTLRKREEETNPVFASRLTSASSVESSRRSSRLRVLCFILLLILVSNHAPAAERLRLMIETDAGGDPDDEQSFVRFLLYSNEWDVEGIIATRPLTRKKENHNPEPTGLGVLRRQLNAYGECYPNLIQHDKRYPTKDYLWQRTVPGYDDTPDGVNLIISAVDSPDPRALWFGDWGIDDGTAESSLKRALDKVLKERGPEGYAKFKNRLRLSSFDKFGDHTDKIAPPFPIFVDTMHPELDKKRWYHRFSAITATAGGFDVKRDVLTNHGPLGALYPTNTTHPQKEGDTMSFLYLVPTGMNDPDHPNWGSWAGRYGHNENYPNFNYYWANAPDTWQGTTHRENSLKRFAEHLQNDFRARLNWCVSDFAHANHPPVARIRGEQTRTASPGQSIILDASESSDPDHDELNFEWILYPECTDYRAPLPEVQNS